MERRTARVRERGPDSVVFVCVTDREERACCGDVGGAAVAEAARDWLRDRDRFWTDAAVVETGCLGACSEAGAAVVVQPADEWFAGVGADEVPALLADVLGDGPNRD